VGLFQIRDGSKDIVRQLAGGQMLSPVKSSRPSDINSLVTVLLREDVGEFTYIDIGTILSLAHLISEADQRWLGTSRIDLGTFNKIYE